MYGAVLRRFADRIWSFTMLYALELFASRHPAEMHDALSSQQQALAMSPAPRN